MRTLSAHERPAPQVLDSDLLRTLALAGWVPDLDSCHLCQGDPVSFSTHTGAVSCPNCELPGAVRLGDQGLGLMRALLAGDWDSVATAPEKTKEAVGIVVSTYLQWQLERGLRSLKFLERNE